MNGDPVFEWDSVKSESKLKKHTISFETAQYAFKDPKRIIAIDTKHSTPTAKKTVLLLWNGRRQCYHGTIYLEKQEN